MRQIPLPLAAAFLIASLPVQAAQTDAPQPQTKS